MKWLALTIALALFGLCQARNEADGRIVAAYSTKTAFSITTTTTVTPFTCARFANTAVCKKRRFRRYNGMDNLPSPMDDDGMFLDGTLEEELGLDDEGREARSLDNEEFNREGRIAITVWTTSSSTYTVTSTSQDTLTTFSISYFCTVAGASMAPTCG